MTYRYALTYAECEVHPDGTLAYLAVDPGSDCAILPMPLEAETAEDAIREACEHLVRSASLCVAYAWYRIDAWQVGLDGKTRIGDPQMAAKGVIRLSQFPRVWDREAAWRAA